MPGVRAGAWPGWAGLQRAELRAHWRAGRTGRWILALTPGRGREAGRSAPAATCGGTVRGHLWLRLVRPQPGAMALVEAAVRRAGRGRL